MNCLISETSRGMVGGELRQKSDCRKVEPVGEVLLFDCCFGLLAASDLRCVGSEKLGLGARKGLALCGCGGDERIKMWLCRMWPERMK